MQITNTANGKSAYGKVRDECPGCGEYDIGERDASTTISALRAAGVVHCASVCTGALGFQ